MAAATKRYRLGTHRVTAPEATIARVMHQAAALGITRVANVTGLDFIGIPTVMVVRPGSRNLSVTQGKGLTLAAAIASGLGEAVESFCAERIPGEAFRAPLRRARPRARYVIPEGSLRSGEATPDSDLAWTLCQDLLGGPERLVPSELIFADFTAPAPPGQGFFYLSTNGLAVGNSHDEALLHALSEIVERDAAALARVMKNHQREMPTIDPTSLASTSVATLLARLDSAGLSVVVRDITSDLGIPCYACRIDDADVEKYRQLGPFHGSGCHPSAEVALCRAITEAAQSRLTLIAGTRDDLAANRYHPRVHFELPEELLVDAVEDAAPVEFVDRSFASDRIDHDVSAVLQRMDEAGIGPILCAELPCPVPGMACVRVIAPGLEPFPDAPWYQPRKRARALRASLQ